MEEVGLISALAIGVLVSSSTPVLMCALTAELHWVVKENARPLSGIRQSRLARPKPNRLRHHGKLEGWIGGLPWRVQKQ
jgi:hypothetical protein